MSDYMTKTAMAPSFLKNQFPLRAAELLFGHEQGWVSTRDVVDVLAWWWGNGANLDTLETELAGLLPDELWRADDLLRRAATEQALATQSIRGVWIYLLLAWLFESRATLEDPLGEVEKVYCDFDHPPEIRDLIRYMPPSEGQPAGESGLLSRWESYVERRKEELTAERLAH